MKLRPEYEPFLTGQEFSASLPMKMGGGPSRLCERVAYLEELVRGKRVIHVGCLDHVRLIERRVRNRTWLHMRLTESARDCLGIDIDAEAAAVAKRLGFDNVVLCDIIRDAPHPQITASRWDYMILGEVVEHIDNPVLFLESIVHDLPCCSTRLHWWLAWTPMAHQSPAMHTPAAAGKHTTWPRGLAALRGLGWCLPRRETAVWL